MLTITIIQILQVLLNVAWWVIVVQFVLSLLITFNVINTQSSFVRSLVFGFDRLTDPLYRPLRRMLPAMGGLDLAPALVLLGIAILQIILNNIAASVMMGGI